MTDHEETGQRSEEPWEAAGIAPEKWAAMSRAERRAATRAPRDRQIRQPGRNR